MPAPPALADHDCPSGTWNPGPAGARGPIGGDCWHEEMPNPRTVGDVDHECTIRGAVLAGGVPAGPGAHDPIIPSGIDDPAHNHFDFLGVTIVCDDTTLQGVTAGGGNDGHVIDDYRSPATTPTTQVPCGVNLDCIEDDMVVGNCDFDHDVSPAPDGLHHGSTTESGWSHSSDFSSGPGACRHRNEPGMQEHDGGNGPGPCVNPPNVAGLPGTPGNNNKADVVIRGVGGTGEGSFVKYVRLGNIARFWGCSNGLGPAGGMTAPFSRRFAGTLAIIPDPGSGTFPACVPPGGASCDLALFGGAVRGDTWLP